MTAYQQALGGGDATLVLSPNSEFFQYFNSEVPRTDPAPAAAQ
jgi:hypothetical protein